MSIAETQSVRAALAGVALACLSTSIGGVTVVLVRIIISHTDALSLTAVRFSIAALVLTGCLAWFVRGMRIERRDLWPLFVLGFIMFAVFPAFMARALADTTAARGGLLFAAQPIVTICMAVAFRVEQLTMLKALGVAAAVVGAGVALGENVGAIAPDALRGDALMFCGMVAAATFNVFSKRYLMKYGSLQVMTLCMWIGALCLWVMAVVFGSPFSGSLDFDLNGWLIVLTLAVPGGALMIFSWGRALQLVTPTQATVAIGCNPLTAILLGAWVLSEPVSVRLFTGFALILSAIVLANLDHVRSGPPSVP